MWWMLGIYVLVAYVAMFALMRINPSAEKDQIKEIVASGLAVALAPLLFPIALAAGVVFFLGLMCQRRSR